jgi:hypothetical protein
MIVTIQRRYRARREMRNYCDDLTWTSQPTSAPFAHVREYAARRRRWDAARRELLVSDRIRSLKPLRLSALEIALARRAQDADERSRSPLTDQTRRAQMDWLAEAVDAMLTARGTPRGMLTTRFGSTPASSRQSNPQAQSPNSRLSSSGRAPSLPPTSESRLTG